MVKPSVFFSRAVNVGGAPGSSFVREMSGWKRPILVNYPTIRRIDWGAVAESWPGEAPQLASGGDADVVRYGEELFVWARAAWRGFLARQLRELVPSRNTSFDGRECHPFTLGYVRGALWELVGHADPDASWVLPAFITFGATADVFGLEWVDDIEDAVDDLKGAGLPPAGVLAFQEGARRGIEEMECYLSGLHVEPSQLVEWFESNRPAQPGKGNVAARREDALRSSTVPGALTGNASQAEILTRGAE